MALDLGQYMSRVGLLRVSESARPPSGLAAVRRHGHHPAPIWSRCMSTPPTAQYICSRRAVLLSHRPSRVTPRPPTLRLPRERCLGRRPVGRQHQIQWKSRLPPHAGSELQLGGCLGSRVSSCGASAHLCEVRALTSLHHCVSGGAVGLALHWGERPAVPRRSKLATTVEHRCATAPI